MPTPISETSIPVYYTMNGKQEKKDLKFKGNFGFNINGKKYTAKNGKVYNEKNQPLKSITKTAAEAYQLIGMSNTADSYKDYTFSQKDIQQAATDQESNCVGQSDRRSRTTIGTAACKSIDGKTKCENGVFTTMCRDNKTGTTNVVSVWMIK